LAIIVLTLNKFLWLKFEVFTGSPIHPPSRCSQEASSCIGAWRPAHLVPARAPERGDDLDVESCGAHGALCRKGFPHFRGFVPGDELSKIPFPGLMVTPYVTAPVPTSVCVALRGLLPPA
jgi:hypothetical protein